MAKSSILMSGNGLDVSIEYNTVNLRFTVVSWVVPSGAAFRVRIFDNGVQIYTRDLIGPETGSENVPGNRRLVEVVDPIDGHPYLAWPVGLTATVEELH